MTCCRRLAALVFVCALLGPAASCGGGSGDSTIASIQVVPATPTVAVGGAVSLTATAHDEGGRALTGIGFVWSSASANVATVTDGVVTGVAPGQARIDATAGGVVGSATVTVTAAAQQPLTVTAVGNGAVTSNPVGINCGSTCQASFDSGTQVTLVATPAGGYTFTGWSGDCTGSGTCSVTMDGPRSVTATFSPTGTQHQLSVTTTGSGTVASSPAGIDCGSTCQASFGAGTVVTLTATPGGGTPSPGGAGPAAAPGRAS